MWEWDFLTVYSFTLSEFQSLWMYRLSKSFQLKIKIKGEKVFICSEFLWDGEGEKRKRIRLLVGRGEMAWEQNRNSALFINHSSEADNSHSESIKVGSIVSSFKIQRKLCLHKVVVRLWTNQSAMLLTDLWITYIFWTGTTEQKEPN